MLGFNSCVPSSSVLGGGRDHRKGIGVNNAGQKPTQSIPITHTHTHTHGHAHAHTHARTFYAGEKYINICITKQYKGLSVVKYLFSQIKM